jgi:hypothetical protein
MDLVEVGWGGKVDVGTTPGTHALRSRGRAASGSGYRHSVCSRFVPLRWELPCFDPVRAPPFWILGWLSRRSDGLSWLLHSKLDGSRGSELLRQMGQKVAQLIQALRYKADGHGFESQWTNGIFFSVHSASNRNEYRKH